MRVFKFGGASVNNVEAIRNMATIVASHSDKPLVVVVSAMGKTTNLLERVIPGVVKSAEEREALLWESFRYHSEILDGLFPSGTNETRERVTQLFDQLEIASSMVPEEYNRDYDRTVSFGELISTTLISGYLNSVGIKNLWIDVRRVIRTDAHYREGIVDFETTACQAREIIGNALKENPIVVTQGFIAGTADGSTTTLGREGSDYSASILSYCLGAEEMTIWKDVPGFLNADPKYFANTVKIDQIPYNEAIELAYYGASVIHPKTVKPIQNKGIPLSIKSFIDPSAEGSAIGPYERIRPLTPLYIFKNNQVLMSVAPKDFSFIAEENLQTIFAVLARLNVRVNMMQNSALSFSFCMDNNAILERELKELLSPDFQIRYNEGLQLITIRYYDEDIIEKTVAGRPIILEQRSRTTVQLLVEG